MKSKLNKTITALAITSKRWALKIIVSPEFILLNRERVKMSLEAMQKALEAEGKCTFIF